MNKKLRERIYLGIIILIAWLLAGTIAYHYLEGWSFIDAFYFSVISLTTVGYGDLHPTNEATRFFTAIYILFGTVITLTVIGLIGSIYVEMEEAKVFRKIRAMERKADKRYKSYSEEFERIRKRQREILRKLEKRRR